MFVDKVTVVVKAGDGGDGAKSFRREKFIDRGGPDGGDGGDGGDVIFRASRNQNTLAAFRYQKRLSAESGEPGSKRKKRGKSGNDLIIEVPVGTVIMDETGNTLADLSVDSQEALIAAGGKGGFGNAHFVSSTRQAPKIAEKGEKTEEIELGLELKMIADVGLIGLPNAGKSTLLAAVSNARPEIANYPFTTLVPNLGVVDIGKTDSLLLADIPGLISGASEGKGLGDEFLRHIERTLVLVHLIDVYNEDIQGAYTTIQAELAAYKVNLSKKPQIVALSKIDGLDDVMISDRCKEIKRVLPTGTKIMTISAKSGAGIKELLSAVNKVVRAERKRISEIADKEDKLPVITLKSDESWQVEKIDDGFVVTGAKIERFAKRTDFDDFHATQRLRDIMRKMGILHELSRKGALPGQIVKIAKIGKMEL